MAARRSTTAAAPRQLGRAHTGGDARFTLSFETPISPDAISCVVAKGGEPAAHKGSGDNPGIALLSVIGSKPSAHVTVDEFAQPAEDPLAKTSRQ